MENFESTLESFFEKTRAYIKTTIELTKLKLLEKVISTTSSLVSRVSIVLVFAIFFIVLTIGIALFLGDLLGKSYYGFFIVSGFYLVIGILLHFFLHKWIEKPISDLILKKTLK